MPYNFKYPIDDNTLFILLALRYNGTITIDDINDIYDDTPINYDNTAIKNDASKNPINIGEIGIDWIVNNFDVVQVKEPNGKIVLQVTDEQQLKGYINKYLKSFPHNRKLYFDEERHKGEFFNFINSRYPLVTQYDDKFFAYKFLPKEDAEKYKMIEYIALLMEKNILSADKDTFSIGQAGKFARKEIYSKFSSQHQAARFFWDYFSEAEKNLLKREIKTLENSVESKKWILVDCENGKNIYYKTENGEEIAAHLPYRFLKLLKYCIDNKEKEKITPEEYSQASGVSVEAAEQYFSEIYSRGFPVHIRFGDNIPLILDDNGSYVINV